MVGLLGRKLLGDIRAQRGQFLAIVATMVLGVALFGASYDSYLNLKASYDRVFVELAFPNRWFTGLDAGITSQFASIEGVDGVTARTVAEVPLRFNQDHALLGRAISMPVDAQPEVSRVDVLSGTYFEASSPGVLLEEHAASHFGVQPGDHIEILEASGWASVTVVGTVVSPEYIWPARSRQDVLTSSDDFAVVFVPESMMTNLAPSSSHPEVLVHYAEAGAPASLDTQVEDLGRSLGAADTYDRIEQPSNAALNEDIQGFGEMSIMFPLMFIIATVMGTYVVLSRLVRAQRPLIGTLLATGMRRGPVFRHYLAYGLAPALVAAVLGTTAGALLARWVTTLYTNTIGLPFHVQQLRPLTIGVGASMALIAGLIAAAQPARAAVRLSPADAMRGIVPSGGGGASWLEHVLPPLSRLPLRWRLVLRNIGRQRRRTVYSATGIVLALTLTLVSWGMLDTTQILVNRQFNEIQRWDARVYLDAPATSSLLDELTAVPGVAAAEAVTTLPIAVSANGHSYSTQITGYQPDTQMHRFLSDSGQWIPLPTTGILAGTSIGNLLDVSPGDTISLNIPGTSTEVPVVLAGFVNEPLGTSMYATTEQLQTLFGDAASSGLSTAELRYDSGVDRGTIRDALVAEPNVVAVTDARALLQTLNSFLGLFYAFVGVMLLFGGLMAGALIFTSMSANVAERAPEIAGLRAAGMSPRAVSRLVSVENIATAALGVVPGLIIGYVTSSFFMSSFSSDLFQFNLAMRPTTPVLAAVGVLALALLAQLPALRSLRRLNLGSVLRNRAS
ncbi:MAG: FtsX-like permease family protein [Dehalococcoidia bacterium]